MRRYSIEHSTTYTFSGPVELQPHTLRLRPREGHELRIESSKITIHPAATLRWHRDVEGNCVSIASFTEATQNLVITSEIIIQQYNLSPLDFLVADYAVNFPFIYRAEERAVLAPYMECMEPPGATRLNTWLQSIHRGEIPIQSISLLLKLNQSVYQSVRYTQRIEEGVQSAEQTLTLGTGSCRDFANLFMVSAQRLGFAARFVSGYLYSRSSDFQAGSTHAWIEVLIPGAGWKGFDPTIGDIAGPQHIAVAVARLPESVSAVTGTFYGAPGASMNVNVWVKELTS